MIVVYQIINLKTFKFYIGSAKDFEKRYNKIKKDWTRHSNRDLKNDALAGDKFIYDKMHVCSSIEEALMLEQWWFDFYIKNDLWGCLYNKNTYVYKFRNSKPHTQETIEKMKASQKIAQNRPEVRAKMNVAHNSPEVKAKKSTSQKIAQNRPETQNKKSASGKIAQNRQETIEKRKLTYSKPDIKAGRSVSQKIAQNRPEV
ncbi:MAG: GIY-YIG nuclease family protein, partial [Nanoarchaeota archaeon]